MDEMEAEVMELEGRQGEMIAIIAKICPNRPRPTDISVVEKEPIDPIRWNHRFLFSASFKFSYEKHRALVLKFPLKCRLHPDLVADMVRAEAGAMGWARNHSALPIPKIRAFDHKGTVAWNTLRRPFLLVDHVPGKHITNKDWENMSEAQKLRAIDGVANVVVLLSLYPFEQIGSLYPKDQKINVDLGPLVTYPLVMYGNRHGSSPQISKLFHPRKSPYLTSTEYMMDIANKHLIHRPIQSPTSLSRDIIEMWIYRSLIPGLVLE